MRHAMAPISVFVAAVLHGVRSACRSRFAAAAAGLALLAVLSSSSATASGESIEAIVVCPSEFRPALDPWIRYREAQGVRVRLLDSKAAAEPLQEAINRAATPATKYVLLVGDAPVIGLKANAARQVPMHYLPTTVSGKFGSTKTLASDLPYGDFDGDGLCDAAVGRVPIDRPEQWADHFNRIRTYERSVDFSQWRNQVQLVGGVGGFGMLADTAIESVTRMMVTGSLPGEVRTSIAYGSPGHPFYPTDRFTDAITRRYNQGCRFWVYAGHGTIEQLDRVPAGPTGVPVLDPTSLGNLQCDADHCPIAMLLCCYTGAIDARVDSFAERMLMEDGGPVAVIAGNRVTMPYGNCTLTMSMIDSIYGRAGEVIRDPAERLGDAWLSAARQLQEDSEDAVTQMRTMVDSIAALVSPAGTVLSEERREHALLYGLFGDPLLKLHPPQKALVETAAGHDFGTPIEVTVTSPIDGTCSLSLDYPLGQAPKSQPGTPRDPNETTLIETQRAVTAGEKVSFSVALPKPRTGVLAIRAHIAGETTWATGSAQTNVRPEVQ